MVLFFSATGNTKFIAQKIAEKIGDSCIDLLGMIKQNDTSEISSERPFVICSPVYVCEMPRFLSAYLKKLPLTGNRDVYFIFTSGGYEGISGWLAKGIARKKKMNYMGYTEFRMPRNYIASDLYPLLEERENYERIDSALAKTDKVAECIKNGSKLKARYVFLFEKIVTLPFNPLWCKFKQPDKDFHTTEKCIGCGKCARLCPVNNIRITDNKPEWIHSCSHCMACIGNCPTEAIEYGNITQEKVKYRIDRYI